MEADEIREFQEQMKEAGEKGIVGVSLAISILAVLVAMITVLGHRSHTQAVLSQSRAADQWSLYQAKKIRQENVSLTTDLLNLLPSANPQATAAKLNDYKSHSAKWDEDLKQEYETARTLEEKTDLIERRADRFDLSEAMLQIGVVLSSITLLTRRKSFWAAGMALGVVGIAIAASVFFIH
ncbi:MAG: DUF4337 domain-containing protein [Acidobacteriaceae bacterium]|nr:DUF4337 domain-containing protein [Acidobacteriaceae bacterium]